MILGSALILALCYVLYRHEAAQAVTRQEEREIVRVDLLTQLMQDQLSPAVTHLRYLADGDALRGYLENGDAGALERAARRAAFFSVETPIYDQVRFIDASGQEVFRINQGGARVPPDQLQNKADRRYVQEANRLAAGEIYISAFDLNIENGRIEQPLKPTVRFAIPVFDAAGRRRGVYAINLLGGQAITRLREASSTFGHRLRLLNSRGYWLKAADPNLEWGFVLPDRAEYTLARSDPALWSRMVARTNGQLTTDNGIFTWKRLTSANYVRAGISVRSDDPYLIMASEVRGAEWDALTVAPQRIYSTVAAALLLLMLISVWLFRGRLLAMRELRAANDRLEQRVTERTAELGKTLEELRYREELLEETGRLASVGGWDFDPATGAGRWTTEVARIHDLDPAKEPNKELGLTFYPGESRQRLQTALQEALTHGTPYDLELEFVSALGVRKWVRTISRPVMHEGKVAHMRGALQDVTARKVGELKLSAQLQRLRLLEQITRAIGERQDLPSILQVVARTLEEELPLDFSCVFLYHADERMLTVAAVGFASTQLGEAMSLVDHARIPIDENGLSRCVRGRLVYEPDIAEHHFPFPQRLLAAGLRAMVAAPLQIESKVFGVLIAARREPNSFSSGECEFLRQLSEHVALAANQAQMHGALERAYEELRTTQQAIIQQERLRVLGQMASGIAHDINNAISPIMLYTDSLLENETGLSERARSSLLTIQQAASDVAETVARMREFYRARDSQSELQPMLLNDLVRQTIELTRARWEAIPQQRGIVIEIRTELGVRTQAALGIDSETREALTNLVFNAVDAMPRGGTLTLRTGTRAADGQPERAMIEIIDTGSGMDEQTRRRCLEPFFTTKGERGTGLGLAMVYGAMQRNGGSIEIDSAPGAGTTIRLLFTIAGASEKASDSALSLNVPSGLTLLLVDDDPTVLKSLRDTLELDGHTILTANGGRDGIDVFRSACRPGGRAISVVITDLGMPHVDGRAMAAAVKESSPQTPVVMLTGWGERLIAEGNTPKHVDRVLSKPPRIRELRKVLAELLVPEGKQDRA
ncbi:MAG: ATP-binding protein [Gammaproteobacteria bacterium]